MISQAIDQLRKQAEAASHFTYVQAKRDGRRVA